MSPKAEEKWIVTQQDIEALFHRFCGYAVYSHIDELKHGFVSVGRKFRVGVSGTAVIENGKFQTIRDITSMTIRIPRAVHGCANSLYRLGVNPKHGVLLAGAPSSGKTTMLRDLARMLAFVLMYCKDTQKKRGSLMLCGAYLRNIFFVTNWKIVI